MRMYRVAVLWCTEANIFLTRRFCWKLKVQPLPNFLRSTFLILFKIFVKRSVWAVLASWVFLVDLHTANNKLFVILLEIHEFSFSRSQQPYKGWSKILLKSDHYFLVKHWSKRRGKFWPFSESWNSWISKIFKNFLRQNSIF